jgi:phage gpG-like protein
MPPSPRSLVLLMGFGMQATGLAELRARIEAMKARSADMKPGLTRAAMVVLRAAKDHIKSGSGDQGSWKPNMTGTPLLFKSGRLINSLTIGVPENKLDVSGNSVEVGTNIPYGRWNQEGTGIYGPTGQPIFPTKKKALAFNGIVVKSIKGTPKRRFLYLDQQQAERIRAVFASYVLKGLPNDARGA